MSENEVKTKINELAESVVLADPKDLQELADLHTEFQELASLFSEQHDDANTREAEKAAALIENIILEDSADPAADLENICALLKKFQDADGQPAAEESSSAAQDTRDMSEVVDESILNEFLSRQKSCLEDVEANIIAVEKKETIEENIQEIKRYIHTLKGESALLGLKDVEHLCHSLEDFILDRDPAECVDSLFDVKDWLNRKFDACSGSGDEPEKADALIEKFTPPAASDAEADAAAAETAPEETHPAPESKPGQTNQVEEDMELPSPTFSIPEDVDNSLLQDFITEAGDHLGNCDENLLNLETNPEDNDAQQAVFRAFHTIKGVAGFLGAEGIRCLAHETENLLDRARKGELLLTGPAIDVTFDAVDMMKGLIDKLRATLEQGENQITEENLPEMIQNIKLAVSGKSLPKDTAERPPAPAAGKKVGEILRDTGKIDEKTLDNALQHQQKTQDGTKLGEHLIHEKAVKPKDVAAALRAQSQSTGLSRVKVRESVKVDAERLDYLVDTIGELVIAEAMVSKAPEISDSKSLRLERHLNRLDKITRELQEIGTSLRMIPVKSTFRKMARLTRDLSKKFNKSIDFITNGEDTELDKNVVDKIGDPLVHLVRNSVDHGIEDSTAKRVKLGKPEKGRVELRAFHKGGNILIEIEDDGRGLDKDKILKKARERGIVKNGDKLSDQEINNLIFQPGFSTAKEVTDVSGRGVGMDVVRRNIESMRGQVEIRSEHGKGSVFSIKMPLTLAIIDGMVVQVQNERYILPTLSILRMVKPGEKDISTVMENGVMVRIEGELMPVVSLHDVFDLDGSPTQIENGVLVIVEDEDKKIAVLVDDLLGQQQIVIKSLGKILRNIPGVSGGAIMPDGNVGLILDVSGLVKLANEN